MTSAAGGLRLLAVTLRYPPHVAGGYELLTRDIVDGLTERGHEVTVLCGRSRELEGAPGVLPWLEPAIDVDFDLFAAAQEASNFERFRLHFLRLSNWRATSRALARTGADALFFFNLGLASLAPVLAARCAGIPTLGYVADLWPLNHWVTAWEESSGDSPKALRLAALSRAWRIFRGLVGMGRLFVPSEFVAGELERGGIPRSDLSLVPLALAPEMERATRSAEPRPRRPGEPLRVISTSMMWTGKGQHVLLESCARAAARGVDLELTLAGDGPSEYRGRLEELAGVPELEGRVRFSGMLAPEAVSDALSRAHVFAFPSLWGEPFGLATIEAMAHGLCPVTSDAGATPEIVRDGIDGLVVPRGDADAMADGFGRLFEDDGRRLELARSARDRARSEYARERFIERIEAELIERTRGGQR